MKTNSQAWQRLARAARQTPAAASVEAPHGFSGRVVARWRAGEAGAPSPWELLASWQPLACAALVMLLSVAVNFAAVRDHLSADPVTPSELISLLSE